MNFIRTKFLKKISRDFYNEFSEYFNLEYKLVKTLPSELFNLNIKNQIPDHIARRKDGGYLIFEFQSTALRKDDILRFFGYASRIYQETGESVDLVVFSTIEKKDNEIIVKWGQGNQFTIHIKSLKEKKAEIALNKIKDRIRNNESARTEDIISLVFLPFFTSEKSLQERFKELYDLTKKIKMDPKDRDTVESMQIILTEKLIKDKTSKKELRKLIRMRLTIIEDIMKEERELGIEQGKRSIIQNMLKKGMDINEISTITDISINEIKDIKDGE